MLIGAGDVTAAGTNTFTGANTFSKPGALSLPTLLLSGAPIQTGGTGTTTHPLFYLNSGTAPTTWSTTGTIEGINAPSGFTGNFVDYHLNGGVSVYKVDSTGALTSGAITTGNNITGASFILTNGGNLFATGAGTTRLSNAGGTGLTSLALGPSPPAVIGAGPTHGQAFTILQGEELLTIAAAATTTTSMQVPANAVVFSISVRVTTIIPTAATFTVTLNATTFNTVAVPVAANTTDAGTKAGAFYNATAAGVVITPNLTPGAATGVVRVTVSYYLVTPPTS